MPDGIAAASCAAFGAGEPIGESISAAQGIVVVVVTHGGREDTRGELRFGY
jgi:hypothetical protein